MEKVKIMLYIYNLIVLTFAILIIDNRPPHMTDRQTEKKDAIDKKMKAFGRNLKKARMDAGLTQDAVGKMTGLTQTFLSRLETTTQKNIGLYNAIAIAEAVRTPLCKLLTPKD